MLHRQLKQAFKAAPRLAEALGVEMDESGTFEVHELRHAMRIAPDGRHIPQLIVALTQSRTMRPEDGPEYTFRGGATLVVDLVAREVKYRIVKRLSSKDRQARNAAFVRDAAADPLRKLLIQPAEEPFAVLHAVAEEVS